MTEATNRRRKPQPHHRPVANELGDASGAMASLASAIRQLVETEVAAQVAAALAERPAVAEMVPIATFAREHSLNPATVRQMIKHGRIDAVRIGKRQWRVRRDSPIGQPMARGATSVDSPAERARRLVEKLK